MYHRVANISRLFTNFTFTDVACEKDADEDVFIRFCIFNIKCVSFLTVSQGSSMLHVMPPPII